jgi:hypothetical protein
VYDRYAILPVPAIRFAGTFHIRTGQRPRSRRTRGRPSDESVMTGDLHEGPLAPASTVAPPPPKLTGREKRRQRRRRRIVGEEILAWILVPAILIGCYYAVTGGLALLGTTPSAVFDQLKQVKEALEKRR